MRVCLLVALAGLLGLALAGDTNFLYMGGNSVLQYQSPKGRFAIWDLERRAVGRCHPFPKLPQVTGFIASGMEKVVFLGGADLLAIDRVTNTFEIMNCQTGRENSTAKYWFKCTASLNASTTLFADNLVGDLAYIEPNMLAEFNSSTGDVTIYDMTLSSGSAAPTTETDDATLQPGLPNDCSISGSCKVEPHVIFRGNLQPYCERAIKSVKRSSEEHGQPIAAPELLKEALKQDFHVVGAGSSSSGQFIVQCRQSVVAVMLRIFPSSSNTFDVTEALKPFVLPHLDNLVPIGGSQIMGYGSDSLKFEIHQCDSDIGCLTMSEGSFIQDLPCTYPTINSCLSDPKCGYCVETAKCYETGNNGPCFGECQKWVSTTNNTKVIQPVRPTKIQDAQVAYIGDQYMLKYHPIGGTYEIHKLSSFHPSHGARCPSIVQRPVFQGQLNIRNNYVFPYHDHSVLFVDPSSGKYSVWRCKPLDLYLKQNTQTTPGHRIEVVGAAPCGVSAFGTLEAASGSRSVVTSGNFTIILKSGIMQLFEERDDDKQVERSNSEARENIFLDNASYVQHVPEMVSSRLFSIGNGYLFDLNPITGAYKIWMLDGRRGTLLGPTSTGSLPTDASYTVAWMGDDRLLAMNPRTNDYYLLRFDLQTMPHDGPLGFITTGRGNLNKENCAYSTCSDCSKDPGCGWCASTGKCIPGNQVEPCDQRCAAWTYGYCSAAKTACANLLSQDECTQNPVCGWCSGPDVCMPQTDGSPLFGQCIGKLIVPSK